MCLRLDHEGGAALRERLIARTVSVVVGRRISDGKRPGLSRRPQQAYVEEEDEEYSDSNYEGDNQERFESDESEDDVPAGYGYGGGGGGGGFGGAGLPRLWSYAPGQGLQGSLV